MAKVLELFFTSEVGLVEKVTVRDPGESLDPAVIKTAMEEIVAADAFATKSGGLISPKSARYVDRTVQEVKF